MFFFLRQCLWWQRLYLLDIEMWSNTGIFSALHLGWWFEIWWLWTWTGRGLPECGWVGLLGWLGWLGISLKNDETRWCSLNFNFGKMHIFHTFWPKYFSNWVVEPPPSAVWEYFNKQVLIDELPIWKRDSGWHHPERSWGPKDCIFFWLGHIFGA